MLRRLPPELWEIRSDFLRNVREFFFQRDYIEAETPLLNPTGGLDPFLDPLSVIRSGARKSPQAAAVSPEAYLITSPEYNLKIILPDIQRHVFQIAHCFREGDRGDHHSEEFLMLEWYRVGADEFDLMDECCDLLRGLVARDYSRKQGAFSGCSRRSVEEVFRKYCGCGLKREELEAALANRGLLGAAEQAADLRYDEIFFTLFLNLAESDLGREGPEFLFHYPRELAALARVEGSRARRFELYWEGLELANGYFELTDPGEQEKRFIMENQLRRRLGKPEMELDRQFLAALGSHYPPVSGIALGLDRLLMLLLDKKNLADVSPFL